MIKAWRARRAARRALDRCYGVPYLSELSMRELRGMKDLEARGDVVRDEGGLSIHWHRNPAGR